MTLAFAPVGQSFVIKQINANDKVRRHLENLGMTIGSTVKTIIDNGGDVVLRVKDGRVALNKALALKIVLDCQD